MCGRFSLIREAFDLGIYLRAKFKGEWKPQYNIAPTSRIPVLLDGPEGREIRLMKWGLVPHWAKDEKIGFSMTNARAETAAEKPGFRDSFKKRRCIIPASGFYEWKTLGPKDKQPYYFEPRDGGLFSFCGLWSEWKKPDGELLETCTIITTSANDVVAPVHDRMPVVVSSDNMMAAWLAPDTSAEELKSFLVPLAGGSMTARAVSKYVNSSRNVGPKCIEAE